MQHNKLVALIMLVFTASIVRSDDSLPSWNDGAAKKAIVAFVERVTQVGSADLVPVAERIAVFDNDGTLWCEAPLPFQAAFAFDEIKRRALNEPKLSADPMVQALLAGDIGKLLEGKHRDGLMQILGITHAGMTTEQFDSNVKKWFDSAVHPRFKKKYSELTYQPMQELLKYLRSNGFKTFIVSGGGADFMRVWSEQVYGIPPEYVVGSNGQVVFEMRDGKPTLVKSLDHLFVDDREGKPVGIHHFIGRRPIACFGNSDGDQAMLEYTTIGNPRPSFGLIVHHTDADREYAYDAHPPSSGKLVTALQAAPRRGWTLVDMKKDWKRVWNDAATQSTSPSGKWLAVEIAGQVAIENAQSTIEFGAEGAVSGNTSVNRYSGKATITAEGISFGPLAVTRRAGPPAMMEQESRFTQALGNTVCFRFDETGRLILTDANSKVVAKLTRMEN